MSAPKTVNIHETALAATGVARHIHPIAPTAWAAPVLWLTGLSGAGKSTLAIGASRLLERRGFRTIVIDGDALRAGLSKDLGFSAEDRAESVRRASEVAALCSRAGITTFVALVSPFEIDRANARAAVGGLFHEVYVDTDYATCRARDPKGLYKLAEQGKIRNFTGLDSPYEAPAHPDLVVSTMSEDPAASILKLATYAMHASLHSPLESLPAASA
ncbi:adenylyl-sulfate kinase [Pararobbsia silviterrae]|uniref:adenylyl-sulfate kinase n=1 Tax=Pararobbsia silviterrae TaxID=1792498 RepID=UPI001F0CCBCE|nr:adenylyl-sulfate kinase [Pararobbsia silviterrae]